MCEIYWLTVHIHTCHKKHKSTTANGRNACSFKSSLWKDWERRCQECSWPSDAVTRPAYRCTKQTAYIGLKSGGPTSSCSVAVIFCSWPSFACADVKRESHLNYNP